MIGKTISHYTILEKLGEGGMGVVWKAEDNRLKRTVALKFLPPQLLASDEEKKRFVNEAQAAAQLDHPNICTIYEIDTADGQTYISMAHIPGDNLENNIASSPLDIENALKITDELCGALDEAHSQTVIHRDIKPANIMISEKGPTILLDFGLAKLKGQTKITRVGSTVGTSAYMSPEQVRGETVDHRTDIWSLGVVLYQMVAGQMPFKGEHEAAVLYSITNTEPAPVTTLRTGVPPELARIIEKALSKDADGRYQQIADMRADLEPLRQDASGPHPVTTRQPVPGTKHRGSMFWAGLLAVIAIIVIAAVFWFRPGSDSPQQETPGAATDRSGSTSGTDASGDAVDQRQKSIAVLPLDNLSRDDENEFFVDGMTEELITQLAQIRALKVISRTSVMRYKDTDKSLHAIGQELNVGTIIEGSVLWAGDQVRISVQLIDAVNDRHIWANSYNSNLDDVLGLQRRVAEDVANQIEVELTDQEKHRLAAVPVVDKEAYEMYLQGRFNWNQRRPDSIERAIDFYEKAIELDPGYALAYAGLAESYVVLATWGFDERVRRAHETAREMAEKALSIDEELAAAHACLAAIAYEHDWDWKQAVIHFERAIELNPNHATTHQWYAEMLTSIGRYEEAVTEIRIAQALDPLSLIISTVAGFALTLNGETDAGFAEFKKIIDIDPSFPPVYLTRQYSFYWIREWEKGAREAIKYLELTAPPEQREGGVVEIKAALDRGGMREFDRVSLVVLKRTYQESYASPVLLASLFARLGEPDSAMVWLQRGYDIRDHQMSTLTRDRSFEVLQKDPRYIKLLKRLKLDHTLNSN
jgi:serine/threonine-protein kinase